MRIIIFMSLCLIGLLSKAQAQVYMTTTGLTQIFSETPMENISADNKVVSAALNTVTKEVVVRIQVIGFKFPNKLMEEHFNENYMETTKFPTSSFKGKIIDAIDFQKNGTYEVNIKGVLEIHGVKQEKTVKAKLQIGLGKIIIDAPFDVKLADFKVDIPKLVFEKIAEVISIKNHFILLPKIQ
ncbi:YceI family protein [Flectobacillus longus]|uniref:YceI family protein n=1 Tax=Flectobacillus longus TaxID=2984207 RepID=UPI0024B72FF7|nr:YceI family protein [Flectobacillus longus]MDI9880591.1 YceI family protein [Flectobacillus longus]